MNPSKERIEAIRKRLEAATHQPMYESQKQWREWRKQLTSFEEQAPEDLAYLISRVERMEKAMTTFLNIVMPK